MSLKKIIIVGSTFLILLTSIIFIVTSNFENSNIQVFGLSFDSTSERSGDFSNTFENKLRNSWQFRGLYGNGTSRRTLSFNENNISSINVSSFSEYGQTFILFYQDNIEELIDITNFEGALDTSNLIYGNVLAYLILENSSRFHISIDW